MGKEKGADEFPEEGGKEKEMEDSAVELLEPPEEGGNEKEIEDSGGELLKLPEEGGRRTTQMILQRKY